jgi:hypothetical protein
MIPELDSPKEARRRQRVRVDGGERDQTSGHR